MLLHNIPVIKRITAFGTESGCLGGVGRLPAALVALVLGDAGRLFAAAFGAELTLILGTAGADPAAVIRRLGTAALRAELAGSNIAAGAFPAIFMPIKPVMAPAVLPAAVSMALAVALAIRPAIMKGF